MNTTISPSVAALALAGVAPALALALAPIQSGVTLGGVAPAIVANNAVAPRDGLPVSWSSLGAGAIGAATPALGWKQARFAVSGVFGTYGGVVLQGSPDNVHWTNLAGVSDPVAPGYALFGDSAFAVTTLGNGIVLLGVTDWSSTPGFLYLRPVVQNGDAMTSLSITGNISTRGAV